MHARLVVITAIGAAFVIACGGTTTTTGAGEGNVVIETPGDRPPAQPTSPAPTAASGANDEHLVVSRDPCRTDQDCVPADCCHATACVSANHAPQCSDVACTQECRYGTLDCGGGCLCHHGFCAARLSSPPASLRR